jgi:hypothetical protein
VGWRILSKHKGVYGVADATDDPFGLRQKPRSEVEAAALEGNTNLAERGAAKAELHHRDREYAEAQEQARRAWEDQREVIWRGHADTLRAAERAHDKEHDLWKLLAEATARDAQAAIRLILAINGGAAIAVLAFAAGLVSRQSQLPGSSITPIIGSLRWFAYGVISTGLAAVAAYLSNGSHGSATGTRERIWQHPYVQPTSAARIWLFSARFFHAVGMIAAVLGLVCFTYGLFKVQQKVGDAFR